MARSSKVAEGTNSKHSPVEVNIDIHIERWPIERLIPRVNNPRTHTREQVANIAASIREFGWTNPVLVDGDDVISAGHARVLAAQQLAMKEIPVIVLRHLTPAQRRALVIADNQLAIAGAGWDEEMLRIEIEALRDADYDLEILGFEDAELALLLAQQEASEGLTDEDEIPPVPQVPVTRPGDLWSLGNSKHRIICGDATLAGDVNRVLAGMKPLLMVCDQPYGVRYDPAWRKRAGINNSERMGRVDNDDRADWREAWALYPGDVAYVWHGALHAAVVAESLESCGFQIRSQIIWAKPSLVMGRGHYHWQHEPCWYAVRGTGHWNGDRKQSTLWQIENRNQDTETIHSTQKPVECMRRPLLNNSNVGQAVYEPFSGSGTTIIACEKEGRVCLAVEVNPSYVDITVTRWEKFTGQKATLEGNGRTFDQVAAERSQVTA
jgi:DNA modification methylase